MASAKPADSSTDNNKADSSFIEPDEIVSAIEAEHDEKEDADAAPVAAPADSKIADRPAHHTGKKCGANKFSNPWPSFRSHTLMSGFKMFLFEMNRVELPKPGDLPVQQPNWESVAHPPADKVQVTWAGHASFLVQFDGYNVLTDPIFSERCSPVKIVGPKRFVPAAFQIENLPPIDAVIISHNHYDHLDSSSVARLLPRVAKWYVPLGIKQWLLQAGAKDHQVVELDWWQESIHAKDKSADLKVVCTPCQHFSGRTLTDRNETLWASWSLVGPSKRFFFGGDTGYRSVPKGVTDAEDRKLDLPVCPAFKEIGNKYGPFDLSCIPIGAYSPRWFMSPIHANPMDAVSIHVDVKSKQSVGMHWGTFVLTDEPILEPPKKLAEELVIRNLPADSFIPIQHGETRSF